MTRYRDITPAEMTPAQRRVHDLIIAGRRGRFGGPFQLLIRAPEICEHAAKLGEHLRWGTSLPDRLSELAIITTAKFWRAQYEWYAHAPLAEKAGVPSDAVEAIRSGKTPSFEHLDREHAERLPGSGARRNDTTISGVDYAACGSPRSSRVARRRAKAGGSGSCSPSTILA